MSFILQTNKKTPGFTLVEFLVSISIGLVILVGVVIGQSAFNDKAALKAVVNEISLSLRQAQIYGISVKENTAGTNDFTGSYGLSFHAAYPSTYVYFIDKQAPLLTYDGSSFTTCANTGSTECLAINTISRGNKLVNPMCRIPTNGGAEVCDIGRADITFGRPSTDARIVYYSNTDGSIVSSTGYKGLRIKFTSPGGAIKSVVVYTTGQISVQ